MNFNMKDYDAFIHWQNLILNSMELENTILQLNNVEVKIKFYRRACLYYTLHFSSRNGRDILINSGNVSFKELYVSIKWSHLIW